MIILGIETSCDETAVAIVQDGATVLTSVIASSSKEHAAFGGVVPELAARRQGESIIPMIAKAIEESRCSSERIDAIAVTYGPGLLTSLLIGTSAARALASVWKKPLLPVHHIAGHLASIHVGQADTVRYPALSLVISGGHSQLYLCSSPSQAVLISATLDDAAGEAFDKGASILGLPYPGGPALSQLAESGNPIAVQFPRPLHHDHTASMSFSGLKTALKYAVRDRGGLEQISTTELADIAASYQEAICLHIVQATTEAFRIHPECLQLHVVGGVSANLRLRSLLSSSIAPRTMLAPAERSLCTDNAAMIASAAYFQYGNGSMPFAMHFQTVARSQYGMK